MFSFCFNQVLYETSHVSSPNSPRAQVTPTLGIPFETRLIFTLGYKLLIIVSSLEHDSPILGFNV